MKLYLSAYQNTNARSVSAGSPEKRIARSSDLRSNNTDLRSNNTDLRSNNTVTHSTDRVTLSENAKIKDIVEKESQSLSAQEQQQLRTLKYRDTEVRNHEQTHLAVAGRYARGGASFTYQKGPDGGLYAVGGEVGIDVSAEASPEATIKKMQTVKRAALAPLHPSPIDRQVAAQASAKEQLARQQLIEEQHEALLSDRAPAHSENSSNKPAASFSTDPFVLAGYTFHNPAISTFSALV